MRNLLTILMLWICATASAQSVEQFKINTSKSKVTWSGKKIVGKATEGTILIESGKLEFRKQKLIGGQIVMNTKSIASETAPARLVSHLKNDDFFAVDKFPTATYVITKISGNLMKGNMTIKGITREMSFPIDVSYTNDEVEVKVLQIKVDRTKFDVKYKSGNIFSGLGDGAIDDNFILDIELVAEKVK